MVPALKLVAVVALPVRAPVNPVEDTDVSPASVSELNPNEILVVPIVTLLFVNALLGMPEKLVPTNVGVAPELIFCGKLSVIAPVGTDAIIWFTVPVIEDTPDPVPANCANAIGLVSSVVTLSI